LMIVITVLLVSGTLQETVEKSPSGLKDDIKKVEAVTPPEIVVGPGKFVGCYEDHNKRDFSVFKGRCDDMTPNQCESLCSEFEYYALQFHDQCRCGKVGWKPRYNAKARA